MLSNSLELLEFLFAHGSDEDIIVPAIERLDAFTEKWRDGTYQLLKKSNTHLEQLKDAVRKAIEETPSFVEFVSVKELGKQPIMEQRRLYRIAYAGNLTSQLFRAQKHQKMLSFVKNVTSNGRNLNDLVELSLGTRSLERALDRTFNKSVTRIVKKDFVNLWYCRLGYVLLGDFAKAEDLDPLIEIVRTTPLLGRLQERPHTWIFWED